MKAAVFQQQQLRAMPEKQFGLQVEEIAKTLGLLYYHTHNSQHSAPGWPDYVIANPAGKGSLFRELKTQTGKVTDRQQRWLDCLTANGFDVGVWRPEDLASGRILAEMQAIAGSSTRR